MSHLVTQSQALTGPAKHLSFLCVTTVFLLASGINGGMTGLADDELVTFVSAGPRCGE